LASDCPIFYNAEIATELGGYVHILEETGKLLYSYNIKDRTMSLSLMASFVWSNDVSSWAMLECRYEGGHCGSEQAKNDNNTEMVVKVVADDEAKYNSTADKNSHLLNLPFHTLRMVMEFCVGVEYMKLRATCKNCHLASPPIQWSNMTLSRRLHTYSIKEIAYIFFTFTMVDGVKHTWRHGYFYKSSVW
nr:PAZ domain-containing protein [Tanacetum cinerariifolium]